MLKLRYSIEFNVSAMVEVHSILNYMHRKWIGDSNSRMNINLYAFLVSALSFHEKTAATNKRNNQRKEGKQKAGHTIEIGTKQGTWFEKHTFLKRIELR